MVTGATGYQSPELHGWREVADDTRQAVSSFALPRQHSSIMMKFE